VQLQLPGVRLGPKGQELHGLRHRHFVSFITTPPAHLADLVDSLSEYGCITNGRDFGEVAALMSDKMTSVYSGGLMYEYALEPNDFGIVKISSAKASSVQEQDGFDKFASALKANPAPTGDGGFTSTTNSVPCPTKDENWLVDSTLLPAIPEGAKKVCCIPITLRFGECVLTVCVCV
jgi:hypothetical protein